MRARLLRIILCSCANFDQHKFNNFHCSVFLIRCIIFVNLLAFSIPLITIHFAICNFSGHSQIESNFYSPSQSLSAPTVSRVLFSCRRRRCRSFARTHMQASKQTHTDVHTVTRSNTDTAVGQAHILTSIQKLTGTHAHTHTDTQTRNGATKFLFLYSYVF